MSRPPRDTRSAAASQREPRAAGSSMLAGAPLAALLSVVGLVIVAMGTFALGSGDLPFLPGGNTNPGSSGGGGNGVTKTATPSNVVVVPTEAPGVKVPGTLVYAKAGNIWVESHGQATQLTTGGNDSMPSFSPDGQSVLFIRTRTKLLPGKTCGAGGNAPVVTSYQMDIPSVMQVPIAGGTPKLILDGAYNPPGRQQWMAWLREPVLSPDGHTIALATDLPDPTTCPFVDVTIKLYDTSSGNLKDPKLPEYQGLGHQDPAWRPDGKVLAFVYNNRDGANGAPQIYGYTVASGAARPISGPGYLHPSWSPDGRYLAVTKTTAYGTDVAVLNASTGAVVTLLTNDGTSWAPTWSPAGDQIAYLHEDGHVVDLRLVTLKGSYGDWTPGDTMDLTQEAGLDSLSRPDWFVPADEIPAGTAAPASSGPASSSGGAATPSPS